jgi:TolA-binding protein
MHAVIRSLIITILLFVAPRVFAADEGRAFTNAFNSFQDGFFTRAENAFSNYVATFPESPRVLDAVLFQARSALSQARYQPASQLLTTNLSRAGALTDRFTYWLGRVQFESGNADAAAKTFSQVQSFTNSPVRLDAALGEAEARFKLKQWPQVAQLIAQPGAFQSAVAVRGTNDLLVARGYLLLAHAAFEQRDFNGAEKALKLVSDAAGSPRQRWERLFLACQIQVAGNGFEDALATTTNLLTAATVSGDTALRAASVALQGDVLHALNRTEDAIKVFEGNLADGTPPERQREAFVKTVELTLERNRLGEAMTRLERFIAGHPTEAGSDLALLTLGELRLKQHLLGTNAPAVTNAAPSTNLVELALDNFDRLVRGFPKSPFATNAQLGRGWALLVQNKSAEALAAFQAAAEGLPMSSAQAVARFKLADLQFASGDMTNAIQNYRRVVRDYNGLPLVQRELVDRALYQLLQASLTARDIASASHAMERITKEYPRNEYAEQSVLLYGQALTEVDAPSARRVFTQFIEQSPQSPLLPEVKLAMARSHEREKNWLAAAEEYQQWIAQFPTNALLPRAEFSRALAVSQSGATTNAFALFTNFVARFVTNDLAARAQNWIGDYYFNRGVQSGSEADYFRDAEKNYQLLFAPKTISTNWPVTDLTFQARLKAGRAAFYRQSWDDAIDYFTNLLSVGQSDARCPQALVVSAAFAYADSYTRRANTNVQDKFSKPLLLFDFVQKQYPNDPNIYRIWGRMADCYLQLASTDSDAYAQAYDFYRKSTDAMADATTRTLAEVGLGHVRRLQSIGPATPETMAMREEALNHYLNVVYGAKLRDGEQADPMIVRDAAVYAAQICESQRKWQRAIELYTRLGELVPAMRANMDRKIADARKQQALEPK